LARNTIRAALRSDGPPAFRVPGRASKLDPFKEEIHDLLRRDPKLPGVRVRELIEPLGFEGSKTIVDDYLREVRPLFVKTRTHQRTIYRPGEICQWDLWEPSAHVPVGHGQTRRAWVVVAYLRFDTNDYSLDPDLVGRRVEVRAAQREIAATCLDSGELAARHERSFAKHRVITALEHARTLRQRHGKSEPDAEPLVQQRPLSVYDQLIA
jgi:hypothetical protein